MAFYNRCVNCTITFDNPRIVSRRMLALDLPLRDLLLAWISLKEVISADHRVCEECVILLQSQAQVNAPVRDYGHKVVCLGCGVSVLRARSIGIDRSRQEYSIIQSWVPQIQPDLPIFSRVCRPCWRRATRAAALNLENIEQEVEHSLPDVNIQMGGALEEIIIKEEISDEDRNQCRLCLSVGRRMQELGEYAPLYRKLLFENNFQNTTIPSFMYQMLACWECHAELRRVKRFQDKVRRANAAFETNQNQKSENMSNLSTIIIGEYNNSGAGNIGRVSGLEACAQEIKEEAIETEVEETSVPDPLAVGQEVGKTEEVVVQIEPEPSITQKVAKRTNPQPKPTHSEPKRARTEQNDPKTSQDQENNPKPTQDTDSAIFAKVKIEIDELEKILAERRNKESFKAMKFKCDSCILGFTDQYRLRDHNKNFHDEDVGSCECEICERRFDDESQMQAHFRNHFVKFVCKLCQFECYTKTGRTVHQKRHASSAQGSSLLEQRLTSKQQAATSRSSLEPST